MKRATVGNGMEVSRKTESRTTIWPRNFSPVHLSGKKKQNPNLKRHMYPTQSSQQHYFQIAKIWKQLECLSTDRWIKKIGYVHVQLLTGMRRLLCSPNPVSYSSFLGQWNARLLSTLQRSCWLFLAPETWTAVMYIFSVELKSVLNIHWKNWCWSWSSNTLATWCQEPTHWKRSWERLRAGGEGGSRGWGC